MELPDQAPLGPTDEEIALCAYRIWLQEGSPQGRDKEQWLKARNQLLSARAKEESAEASPSRDLWRSSPGAS
ncbi:MAG: DUF2934 domain-containing protein [Verrucomicrobiae bacterium]